MRISQRYEEVPIDSIVAHPDNPRVHDKARIRASLVENDWAGVVVVQEATRRILGGHGSWEEAKGLGAKVIPVVFVDVDDDRAKRLLLGLNAPADHAGYRPRTLEAVLDDLLGTKAGLAGTGWDDFEFATDSPPQPREKKLRPATRAHILLSFPPELYAQVQAITEAASRIEGVEARSSMVGA